MEEIANVLDRTIILCDVEASGHEEVSNLDGIESDSLPRIFSNEAF